MTERDHRKPKTPPKGIAEQIASPPAEDWDDITGQVADPATRRARRAQRPTDRRLEILEDAKDELRKEVALVKDDVAEVKETVAKIEGKMEVWPKIHTQLETLLSERGAVLHARLDIDRDDRAFRREIIKTIVTKAIIGIAAVWALIATILLAKYGLK